MTEQKLIALYHGTSMAVHNSHEPFLKPQSPLYRDEGDPAVPFICLTGWLLLAKIYTQKSHGLANTSTYDNGLHVAVFTQKPDQLDTLGYVYGFPLSKHDGFERPQKATTAEWVTYRPLNVKNALYHKVQGLEQLMEESVQCLYLKRPDDMRLLQRGPPQDDNEELSRVADLLGAGILGHLNADTGMNPYNFRQHCTPGFIHARREPLRPGPPSASGKPGSEDLIIQ